MLTQVQRASRFVALKIKKAKCSDAHEIDMYNMVRDIEGSRMHVIQLIDHFTIHGPNGTHSCLVFPAMGPRVIGLLHDPIPGNGSLHGKSKRFSLPAARQILLQAATGLDYLHNKSIVHGDFHVGNWLLELQDLDELLDKDLSQDPKNVSAPVRRLDGKQSAGHPRYLTLSEPLYEWIATGANLCVRIADLGNGL
jgi:serine/threonine-protein kinase SRPK3